MGILNTDPVGSSQPNEYFIDQAFTTRNDAGAVTNSGKNWGTDLAITRSANGVYLLTFAASRKPTKARCFVNVQGNTNVTGNATYDPSTGVVTVRLWAQGGAADNTASLIVEVLMFCSKSRGAA